MQRKYAAGVGAFALMVLLGGWVLDIASLRTIAPMWSPMAPLTAFLLLLLAVGIVFFERRPVVANIILLTCFVVGAAVLVEYLLGVRLGLEQLTLLFRHGHAPVPELPAPDTAAAVMMVALALACLRTRNTHLHDFADVVTVVIGIVCLQVLLAYVYHGIHASSATGFRQVAPHSTLSMMVLAHRRDECATDTGHIRGDDGPGSIRASAAPAGSDHTRVVHHSATRTCSMPGRRASCRPKPPATCTAYARAAGICSV